MTDQYAVFGRPISHSKSPTIHAAFARSTGQDLSYGAIEAPLDGFAACLEAFVGRGGRGANVTAPFKPEAYALANELSDRARASGAVNALRFEAGQILGENFDGVGLVRDIEANLKSPIVRRRVLLLGAGGAARGSAPALLECGPLELIVVNRSADKAALLADAFRTIGPIRALPLQNLPAAPFDIIVNATSAGWTGEGLAIPDACFGGETLAYDMVYGQGLTPFLRQARGAGARALADGAGMLVEQAAEAFEWWRGVRPPTHEVIATISTPLE